MWLFPLRLMLPAHFLPFPITKRIGTLDSAPYASWQTKPSESRCSISDITTISPSFLGRAPPRPPAMASPSHFILTRGRQLSHVSLPVGASSPSLSACLSSSFLSIWPVKVLQMTFPQVKGKQKVGKEKSRGCMVSFDVNLLYCWDVLTGTTSLCEFAAQSDSFSSSFLDKSSPRLSTLSFSSRIRLQPLTLFFLNLKYLFVKWNSL